MPVSPRRRLVIRLATVVSVLLGGLLATLYLLRQLDRHAQPHRVDTSFQQVAEHPLDSAPWLVADSRAGLRPRRDFVRERDGTRMPTDGHGLFGDEVRPAELPGPRILLIGDDLLAWSVADEARLGRRLQDALRAGGAHPGATVLDASCEGYGPVEIALRAPELVRRYDPQLLVVVLNQGDDLAALLDPRHPQFAPGGTVTPPDPERRQLIPLTDGWLRARGGSLPPRLVTLNLAQRGLFSMQADRGLNLADRLNLSLRWLGDVAPRAAGVLIVVAPAAVDVDPDRFAEALGDAGADLLEAQLGARAGDLLRATLRDQRLAWFDAATVLEPLGAGAHDAEGRLSATAQDALAAPLARRITARLRAF